MFQRRWLFSLSLILLSTLLSALTMPVSGQGSVTQNTQPPPSAKATETKSTAALPTIEQILEKYAQAIGGEAAIQALTSRVMKGTITVPSINARGTMEVYAKAANKELTEIA